MDTPKAGGVHEAATVDQQIYLVLRDINQTLVAISRTLERLDVGVKLVANKVR